MHRGPENSHRRGAVDAEHALGRIGLVPFGTVADGHGRHALQLGLAVVVGLAKPLVGDHAPGEIFLFGQPLVDGRNLVRIEQAAGIYVVVHPLAYRTGVLGFVLHQGQHGPHHLHAVHEEGVSAPVGDAPLQAADVVRPPTILDDPPAVTPLGIGHTVEHPVDHLLRIVVGALFGIQPGRGIDAQRKQNFVETALPLAVQRFDRLLRPLQVAFVAELLIGGVEHVTVTARSVLLQGNVVDVRRHRPVIEVGVVVVPTEHLPRSIEAVRHRTLYLLGSGNVRHGIVKAVGQHVVPPVAPVSPAEGGHIGIGIVHHDIPPVVAVEIVLDHLHEVVSVLIGLVYPVQPAAENGRQRGEALVEFAAVSFGSLPHVVHGGIESERLLRYVALRIVEPDDRPRRHGRLEVERITVELERLAPPVYDPVGHRHVIHLLDSGNGHLTYSSACIGHCICGGLLTAPGKRCGGDCRRNDPSCFHHLCFHVRSPACRVRHTSEPCRYFS